MDPVMTLEINELSQQYLGFKNLDDIEKLSPEERVQILGILNKFFGIFYYLFQENNKKSDWSISSGREKEIDSDHNRPIKIRKKISSSGSKEESPKNEFDISKKKTSDGSSIILKSFLGFDADDFDNMISKLPPSRIYSSRGLAVSLYSRISEYQLSHLETRKICEHTLFMIKNGIKMIDKIIETLEIIEITNIYTVSDVENEFDKFSSDTFDVLCTGH